MYKNKSTKGRDQQEIRDQIKRSDKVKTPFKDLTT